ncbi:MAG TPA: tRNA (N6-threonylcarbamoyladenosine(37)-N6)-methyltransferase TrmO [Synergistales bacterium]|nr:tRNA (N6-threonylcarbamoyladenosine(37)-N6)-methyltransferase TrmO [Synergistales bacterium]
MIESEWTIQPVGIVRSSVTVPVDPDLFRGKESRIEVDPVYSEAMDGLEEEEYILVVFRFHLSEECPMKVHPRGDLSRPLRGVFATCSPARPNFIGVSKCELLKIEGSIITVRGLDAINGSPVLDIKPFRL